MKVIKVTHPKYPNIVHAFVQTDPKQSVDYGHWGSTKYTFVCEGPSFVVTNTGPHTCELIERHVYDAKNWDWLERIYSEDDGSKFEWFDLDIEDKGRCVDLTEYAEQIGWF